MKCVGIKMSNISLADVENIIEELEGVEKEHSKGEGMLESVMNDIKDQGCKSLEAAEETLKKLGAKITRRENKLQSNFDEFIEDFGEIFE